MSKVSVTITDENGEFSSFVTDNKEVITKLIATVYKAWGDKAVKRVTSNDNYFTDAEKDFNDMMESAYDEGFRDGYEEGYVAGDNKPTETQTYEQGYLDGYDNGFNDKMVDKSITNKETEESITEMIEAFENLKSAYAEMKTIYDVLAEFVKVKR